MIKRFPILILLVLLVGTSHAQFDTSFAKANIRTCADSLVKAFKTKDWSLFTRYSYPALIGSMGGKEAFISYLTFNLGQIPDSAWKKYETGRILQVIKTAGDLQAIVEVNSVIEWQGKRISSTHHLIAESWDGGLFWTFFDSQNDPIASTLIKPDLSADLVIPKKVEKVESIKAMGNRQ